MATIRSPLIVSNALVISADLDRCIIHILQLSIIHILSFCFDDVLVAEDSLVGEDREVKRPEFLIRAHLKLIALVASS